MQVLSDNITTVAYINHLAESTREKYLLQRLATIKVSVGQHVDRFADANNHLLPTYNSLFFDPTTSGVDALAQQNLGSENNFVNAPFALIPQVLKIIATIIAQCGRASCG